MSKKPKIVNIPFMKYFAVASGEYAGHPTFFEDKIISGEKIHTIRKSFGYWSQRIDNAQKVPGSIYKLSLWSDRPYISKQYQADTGDAKELWYLPIQFKKLTKEILIIGDQEFPLEMVAYKDGLPALAFRDWFKSFVDDKEPSIIIGWSQRPYH